MSLSIIVVGVWLLFGGFMFSTSKALHHDHAPHHVHRLAECRLFEDKEIRQDCEQYFERKIADKFMEASE